MKKGFAYDKENDCFICKCGKKLIFDRVVYKKTNQNYYRLYKRKRNQCLNCLHLNECAYDKGAIRINVSAYYPAFYGNKKRTETIEYQKMKRLRSIWAEGTFAVLKREHKLKQASKRGLNQLNEECILAAIALNLKRMVKVLDNMPLSFENFSSHILKFLNYPLEFKRIMI